MHFGCFPLQSAKIIDNKDIEIAEAVDVKILDNQGVEIADDTGMKITEDRVFE